MKFGDILIENFLAIKEARVILGNRGLVNVAGINADDTSASSNGAGKSSFADALCWCLFGKTARGDTGDAVINDVAKKGTKVDVELLDGADQWKVIRHRKHKTGKNALHLWHYDAAGTATDLSQGTDALTQAKLESILGCSYEVFVGAVYSGQEQMPDLPALTDKNLKVLVEEASGTTLLERGHRLALDAVNAAKAKMQTAAVDLSRALHALTTMEAICEGDREEIKLWEGGRGGRVAGLVGEAKAAAGEAKRWHAEAQTFDRAALTTEVTRCDAAIAAVGVEQARLTDLNQEVRDGHILEFAARNAAQRAEQTLNQAQGALAGVEHTVGCPCTSCGRAITADEIAPQKKTLTERVEAYEADFKAKRIELDTASKAHSDAVKARDAFAAGMTDISATIAVRDAAKRNLDALDRAVREQQSWTVRAKDKVAEVNKAKSEPNPHEETLKRHTEQADNARKAHAAATTVVEQAEAELELSENVAGIFAPAGVRAHILDTVTPFLNDRTARYLGTLSDGMIAATWTTLTKSAKGELKEKFSIEVAKDKGGQRFSSLSGGEKRKVRVATALALQDLVASRATKPIELFIGDEIDDALDPAGVERLMSVLQEKARERGSVFVISHNSLKDWISTTLTFVRKNGVSHVQEMVA